MSDGEAERYSDRVAVVDKYFLLTVMSGIKHYINTYAQQ